MSYVDSVVTAVPNAKKDDYRAYCEATAAIFRKHGASATMDAWGDDVPQGKLTDYYRSVQAEPGETVAIGWIIWPDKSTRDAGWQKVMADGEMQAMQMPFDGKRMIYGGFAPIYGGFAPIYEG